MLTQMENRIIILIQQQPGWWDCMFPESTATLDITMENLKDGLFRFHRSLDRPPVRINRPRITVRRKLHHLHQLFLDPVGNAAGARPANSADDNSAPTPTVPIEGHENLTTAISQISSGTPASQRR